MGGRAGGTGIAREFSDVVPGVVVGSAVTVALQLLDGGGTRSLLLLALFGVAYGLGKLLLARRRRRREPRPLESVPSPSAADRDGVPESDEGTPGDVFPQAVEDRTESTTTRQSALLALLTVAVLLLALAVLLAGVSLGIAVAVVAWLLLLVSAARWARAVSDALRDVLVNVAVVSVGGALAIGGVPVVERVAFEVWPPRPPEDARAREITTLDGVVYPLRAVGDFVYAELPDMDMEVQGRREARTDSGQRRILLTALAVRSGSDRIAIRAGSEPELRVNDRPLALTSGSAPVSVPGEATVQRTGKQYQIVWTDLAELSVNAEEADSLNFEFRITAPEQERGPVRGLLGNADGEKSNDLTTPGGRVLPTEGDAASQAQIDGLFADSWRAPPGTRRLLD